MIVKLLGILDIIVAIIAALSFYKVASFTLVLIAAAYLMIKALIFFGDALSMVDGALGLLLMLNFALGIIWISYVIAMYFLAKGVISML